MGDRRFPQHAHGAAATIAYRASPSPSSCGYFWSELPRIYLPRTPVNKPVHTFGHPLVTASSDQNHSFEGCAGYLWLLPFGGSGKKG